MNISEIKKSAENRFWSRFSTYFVFVKKIKNDLKNSKNLLKN